MLPYDSSCEAEYEDGYIHSETELDDASPFVEGENVFADILKKRPEAEHGKMLRFSVFWKDQRYDIDWTTLPENARPIRFRHGFLKTSTDGSYFESGWSGIDFGYQFNDESGKNQQEILNL